MRVDDIRAILKGTLLTPDNGSDVASVCAGDLMSDVLRLAAPNSLLLTGLAAPSVVYTAEMVDVKMICFVRGKAPDRQTVQLAVDRGIALVSTPLLMFESCGRLFARGLKGTSQRPEAPCRV